mgnify:CR=1 FL=1|jgi:hypothetical protein
MIEIPRVNSTEGQRGTEDDDNDIEDEGMEEETAANDEDYIEGQNDTSNASSKVKEKKKGKWCSSSNVVWL